MRRLAATQCILCVAILLATVAPARAFILTPSDPDPWLSTASGPRLGNGAPATITWSIVPDGTITERNSPGTAPSNLISWLNTNFGGSAAQTNLTLQPWFHIFTDSFGRWSQLGAVNYVFEPHDDAVHHPSADGILGVRGDIRIAGVNVDGSGSTLAFTYVPTGGSDMVVDTSETTFFKNSGNNFLNFRNTLMHEIGHSFGLEHVDSTTDHLLMEPIIDTSFDGPQLDEVRGVQYFFGDVNEKSNGGLGNSGSATATGLGTLSSAVTKSIGTSANVPKQTISPTATDFVSISNLNDLDFYSFTVTHASELGAVLTPRGGVFTQGAADFNETPTSFNANARNNLAISIFAPDGTTVLANANAAPAGGAETIANILLPAAGTYFARVTGSDNTIQLYQLSLTATSVLEGDYNKNGVVDAADYVVWRNTQGQAVTTGTSADGNFDGQVTAADYDLWQAHFGETLAGSGANLTGDSGAVPEPGVFGLVVVSLGLMIRDLGRSRSVGGRG